MLNYSVAELRFIKHEALMLLDYKKRKSGDHARHPFHKLRP